MQRRSFSFLEVLVLLAILLVLAGLGAAALLKTREGAGKTKCSNTLRQIAMSAIQYGDDKRLLPHFNAIRTLDGDNKSTHTPVAVRALVWYGYHDNPEFFICPDSDDVYVPITDREVLDDMRLWGWTGTWASAKDSLRKKTSPWRDGGAGGDVALVATAELSYAFTRQGYNRNVAGPELLGADRSARGPQTNSKTLPGDVGNSSDGWNVVRADSSVSFVDAQFDFGDGKSAYDHLVGTNKGEGFLPLSDVARPK